VRPLQAGLAIAAVVSGPPLYSMVQNGDLDGVSALERGGLVAAVCTVGAAYVHRLLAETAVEEPKKKKVIAGEVAATPSEAKSTKPTKATRPS